MTFHKAIVLFYRYFIPAELPDVFNQNNEFYVEKLEKFQRDLCNRLGCRGRILLSAEGINGTLSGTDQKVIEQYITTMSSFHLLRDCGLPKGSYTSDNDDDERYQFFRGVDWKESSVESGVLEPFPDLKVSIVKEIVNSGGQIPVDEIPEGSGKHLTPREFHEAITHSDKPVVLVDVRNTFEFDIGHFVAPQTGEAAMNPEMVTFSSFDNNFCAKHADELKDKKVLMYCTGGVRCEKASVMLRKRGVEDVNQLSGGIHRYLEEFGNDGHYKGLNFVFDQRVAMKPEPSKPQNEVVGRCISCNDQFDEICGSRVCTVCRDLVLVCPACQTNLREYHCRRHTAWKDCYFTFLEVFEAEELQAQSEKLDQLRASMIPANEHRNQRRTLSRQIVKISEHVDKLKRGEISAQVDAPRRCRTCWDPVTICDGRCWGFWRTTAAAAWKLQHGGGTVEDILPVAIGDIVEPGEHWNSMRLGEKVDDKGQLVRGTVTEVKGWSGENGQDCVAVMWDDGHLVRSRNQTKAQPQIYRWGVLALNGTRLYDVRRVASN